jgi:hypothetical protein
VTYKALTWSSDSLVYHARCSYRSDLEWLVAWINRWGTNFHVRVSAGSKAEGCIHLRRTSRPSWIVIEIRRFPLWVQITSELTSLFSRGFNCTWSVFEVTSKTTCASKHDTVQSVDLVGVPSNRSSCHDPRAGSVQMICFNPSLAAQSCNSGDTNLSVSTPMIYRSYLMA